MAEMKWKKYLPYAGGVVTLAMAILGMAAGLTITASAAGDEQNQGNTSGKTTVRLGVAKEIPANISFEVPLYYTAAIVKTDPDQNNGRSNQVFYPEGYYIQNNSLDNDASKNNPKELVVAKVEVSSVQGAEWDLVDAVDNTAANQEMAVKIGNLPLPAVTKGDTTLHSASMKDRTSSFYKKNDDGTGTYLVLGDHNGDDIHDTDGRTDLDVEFDIPKDYVPSNSATVGVFRVVYTLTTKNADGSLVGVYDQDWVDQDYLGPDKKTKE